MARTAKVAADSLDAYVTRVVANVGYLIELNKFALEQAAGLAGIGYRTLRALLAGVSPPGLGTLVGLAEALGVEPSDLLREPSYVRDRYKEVADLSPFVVRGPEVVSLEDVSAKRDKASSRSASRRSTVDGPKGGRRIVRTDWCQSRSHDQAYYPAAVGF